MPARTTRVPGDTAVLDDGGSALAEPVNPGPHAATRRPFPKFVTRPERAIRPVREWRSRPPSSRTAVARLMQLLGLVNAVTVVLPAWQGRIAIFGELVPMAGIVTARAATGVVGLLLLYLGAGLRRGRRRAWQLALALSATNAVLHVVKGGFGAAAFSALLLTVLIVKRDHFHAIGDPQNRWRALRALSGLLGAGFLLGLAEIAVRSNRLVGNPGLVHWVEHAALGLVGVSGPLRFVHPLGASTVSVTTGAFGLLAIAAATVLLLRPRSRRPTFAGQDESRLRELLHRHGDVDSLGYFALRQDKSLIWAPSGNAAIAYRVINGVSLASGDPIGVPSAWPEAITAWLSDCTAHGWTPAVLACGKAGGTAYSRRGLDVLELGDEAIIDVAAFSLDGRPMRAVRQAVARMHRAGYTCDVVRQRDLAPETLAEAMQSANALRHGKVERGFSMALSRLGDAADGDCLLVLCRDGEGRLRGLLNFVPWGADGFSLDLMRGDRTAGNGLTELMTVSAVEAARNLGMHRISLNFAVLRSVFARSEELGAGPVVRVWAQLLRRFSRLWQIESLYRANAKYQPRWQPRYLCFPSARDLPSVAVAVLSAEAFLGSGRGQRNAVAETRIG